MQRKVEKKKNLKKKTIPKRKVRTERKKICKNDYIKKKKIEKNEKGKRKMYIKKNDDKEKERRNKKGKSEVQKWKRVASLPSAPACGGPLLSFFHLHFSVLSPSRFHSTAPPPVLHHCSICRRPLPFFLPLSSHLPLLMMRLFTLPSPLTSFTSHRSPIFFFQILSAIMLCLYLCLPVYLSIIHLSTY